MCVKVVQVGIGTVVDVVNTQRECSLISVENEDVFGEVQVKLMEGQGAVVVALGGQPHQGAAVWAGCTRCVIVCRQPGKRGGHGDGAA